MITSIYFSDAHNDRDGVSEEIRQIVQKAKTLRCSLYSVGDMLNILPLGPDGWEKWLYEFEELLEGYPITVLGGNHDPYRYLKRLFKDVPNVTVEQRVTKANGVHLRHGHSWSPDWWLLRHIAPAIVEFMVNYLPKPWYWFSKKMGWIPSKLKEAGVPKKRRYVKEVSFVWRKGIAYSQRHDVVVVNGHTHCQGGCVGEPGIVFVVDCGAAKDGDYLVEDTQGIERCNLYRKGA